MDKRKRKEIRKMVKQQSARRFVILIPEERGWGTYIILKRYKEHGKISYDEFLAVAVAWDWSLEEWDPDLFIAKLLNTFL